MCPYNPVFLFQPCEWIGNLEKATCLDKNPHPSVLPTRVIFPRPDTYTKPDCSHSIWAKQQLSNTVYNQSQHNHGKGKLKCFYVIIRLCLNTWCSNCAHSLMTLCCAFSLWLSHTIGHPLFTFNFGKSCISNKLQWLTTEKRYLLLCFSGCEECIWNNNFSNFRTVTSNFLHKFDFKCSIIFKVKWQ